MSGYQSPADFDPGAPQYQHLQYSSYGSPAVEKSYEDKMQEKARKWQQLQNKRYGEKRKFGKWTISLRMRNG